MYTYLYAYTLFVCMYFQNVEKMTVTTINTVHVDKGH